MTSGSPTPPRLTPALARRESKRKKRLRTEAIIERLREEYPEARCALHHANPFQLLVATILSAQCTDKRVNLVTPTLFRRYPDPAAFAAAELPELEETIRSTGFFRNKARALKGLGQALVTEHDSKVPDNMETLRTLPGVGRKTANVVLGNAFGIDEGIVVDTHVQRLSGRLGLTQQSSPEKIESDLMEVVSRDVWTLWAHLLILHGRNVCRARRPLCDQCVLVDLCPAATV